MREGFDAPGQAGCRALCSRGNSGRNGGTAKGQRGKWRGHCAERLLKAPVSGGLGIRVLLQRTVTHFVTFARHTPHTRTNSRWPAPWFLLRLYHRSRVQHPASYAPPAVQYDADESGCVSHVEFLHLLRDMDGLPLHFAPDEDPEHQLAVLQAKRWALGWVAACAARLSWRVGGRVGAGDEGPEHQLVVLQAQRWGV